jgi:hypothetical protein
MWRWLVAWLLIEHLNLRSWPLQNCITDWWLDRIKDCKLDTELERRPKSMILLMMWGVLKELDTELELVFCTQLYLKSLINILQCFFFWITEGVYHMFLFTQ